VEQQRRGLDLSALVTNPQKRLMLRGKTWALVSEKVGPLVGYFGEVRICARSGCGTGLPRRTWPRARRIPQAKEAAPLRHNRARIGSYPPLPSPSRPCVSRRSGSRHSSLAAHRKRQIHSLEQGKLACYPLCAGKSFLLYQLGALALLPTEEAWFSSVLPTSPCDAIVFGVKNDFLPC
jgi:hypothetical protein